MNDRRNNERRSYDRGGEDRRQYERRDYNRRELIDRYFPFVKMIAMKMGRTLPSHIDIDELVNSGVIGLMLAAERYDPSRETQFKTFASWRIRGEIIECFRDQDYLTRRTRTLVTEFNRMKNKLDRENDSDTNIEVVMDHMKLKERDKNILRQTTYITSVTADEFIPDYTSDEFIDKVSDYLFIKDKLAKAINRLSHREQKVIKDYYFNETTFKKIGEDLEVTESRVSQIHQEILVKLKEKLSSIKKQERAA